MNHSFALDIIVFAVIALVLFVRLRKVLGERQDGDPPPIDASALLKPRAKTPDPVTEAKVEGDKTIDKRPKDAPAPVNWTQAMPNYGWVANATTHNRLLPLAAVDPAFHPANFLQGARRAYDVIVLAFARGELPTLHNLLSADLYETFKDEIEARQAAGQTREIIIHQLQSALISDAVLNGTMAYVTVDFITEQSITLRDRDGQVVDGLDGTKHRLHERWVFSNDLKDDETLWRLAETDAVD